MGRRELREHIFRLLFRRDFFPEEEMKEQEALYIEYLADPEQEEVDYIVQKTEKIIAMIPELDSMVNEHAVGWQTDRDVYKRQQRMFSTEMCRDIMTMMRWH